MPADAAVQFHTESAHAAEPYLTNTHTHTTIKLMPADAAHAVQFPAESALAAEPFLTHRHTHTHAHNYRTDFQRCCLCGLIPSGVCTYSRVLSPFSHTHTHTHNTQL